MLIRPVPISALTVPSPTMSDMNVVLIPKNDNVRDIAFHLYGTLHEMGGIGCALSILHRKCSQRYSKEEVTQSIAVNCDLFFMEEGKDDPTVWML